MEDAVTETGENEGMKKSEENKKKRVEFDEDQRKEYINTSKLLKKILIKDEGRYIISCLETIPNNDFEPPMMGNLVNSLQYYYPRTLINMLLIPLINPPYVCYEIKEIIQDVEVNNFLDYIYDNYSYRISKMYRLSFGETDWQNINTNPMITENGISMSIQIITKGGKNISFTSPLSTLPLLSYHFLRHINRAIDLLKERAISEVNMDEINKLSNELKNLLDRLENHEKEKSNITVINETTVQQS